MITKNELIANLAEQGYQRIKFIVLHEPGVLIIAGKDTFDAEGWWGIDLKLGKTYEIDHRSISDIISILNLPIKTASKIKFPCVEIANTRIQETSCCQLIMAKINNGFVHLAAFFEEENNYYFSSHSGAIDIEWFSSHENGVNHG